MPSKSVNKAACFLRSGFLDGCQHHMEGSYAC